MTVGSASLLITVMIALCSIALKTKRETLLNDEKTLALWTACLGVLIGVLVAFLCGDSFEIKIRFK
jgi:formate hydrogenlyase subunit 3/multisubunit Na+/H+ antiporter MnhD subunit